MLKKNNNEGLGLWGFILVGFTFIASITFTFAFSRVIMSNEGQGLGIHVLWVYLIEGFAALICAWSFAKLVQTHPETNGGAMQFSRSAFGKFWGLIAGLLNYFSLPLIICTMTISIFRTNFGHGGIVNIVDPKDDDFVSTFGNWGKMICDLAGILVFFLAASVIYFGISRWKKVAVGISIINWLVIGMVVILCIASMAINGASGIDAMTNVTFGSIGAKTFAKNFMTLFFTFAGLETFITSGAAIKNRAKTLPIGITLILIFVTLFYIVLTILIMCAVGDGYGNGNIGFASNPILIIFQKLKSNGVSESQAKLIGSLLILVTTILVRFNSLMNITLFGGALLEPLSKQKFVTSKMAKLNKRTNLPLKAIFVTTIIFVITLMLFLIIPDIIEGITGSQSPFDFSSLEGITSFILICIYITAVSSVLKLSYDNKIKLNIFEFIGFILVAFFLAFLVIMFFWNSIVDPLINEHTIQGYIGVAMQVLYIIGLIAFAFYSYFRYHKKEMARIVPNSEEDLELSEYVKVYDIIESPTLIDNQCFKPFKPSSFASLKEKIKFRKQS